MLILKLQQVGKPVLRQTAKKLSLAQLKSQRVQGIIDAMVATLRDAPGVGLAAPQVGQALRIVIIEDLMKYHEQAYRPLVDEQGRKPVALKVLVNPVIKAVTDAHEHTYFEGCLSIDGYTAVVPRAHKVTVAALDRTGKHITFVAQGWLARIVQHEIDHLNGQLYIDKMLPQSFMTIKNFSLDYRKHLEADIHKDFVN